MINLKLQPDISYDSKIYTRFGKSTESSDSVVLCQSPIVEVYKNIKFPFLLLAEGGQGKSTSSKILQAHLICQSIACHIYECKNITGDTIKSLASKFSKDSIIIFDAWDELRRDVKNETINTINALINDKYKVIITSRYNPASDDSKDSAEKDLFEKFKNIATISTFKEEQIKEIIGENIDETSRLFSLFENTMFLSMYMELDDEDKPKFWDAQNSYQFMREYFEILLNKKEQGEVNIDKLFYDVGKIIYLEYKLEDSQRCRFKNFEFETTFSSNVNTYSSLNSIVYEYEDGEGNFKIQTSQVRYKNFCLSIYLKYKLLQFLKNTNRTVPEALNQGYVNGFTTLFDGDFIEAFILVGESLNSEQIEKTRSILDYSKYNIYSFMTNILYILLGANNQCFDDEFLCIPGKNLDVIPFTWFEAHKYIKKIHLHYVTNLGSGEKYGNPTGFSLLSVSNLKEITVSNEHPTFKVDRNCLIRKENNSLIIGFNKSEIPDYVTTIGRNAFSSCKNLKAINIPNSVTNIEDSAFDGCHNLKELILPDSVTNVGSEIIRDCRNLEKLVIGAGLGEIDMNTFFFPIDFHNLCEIIVSPGNPNYYSEGNCLINRNKKTIVLGCKNSKIPQDIKEIGANSFSSIDEIGELIIPNGVEIIEYGAFMFSNIRKIVLPNTIEYIGEEAFDCSNLDELEIPSSLKDAPELADAQIRAKRVYLRNSDGSLQLMG